MINAAGAGAACFVRARDVGWTTRTACRGPAALTTAIGTERVGVGAERVGTDVDGIVTDGAALMGWTWREALAAA